VCNFAPKIKLFNYRFYCIAAIYLVVRDEWKGKICGCTLFQLYLFAFCFTSRILEFDRLYVVLTKVQSNDLM
jgi:hypothetical protein